MKKRQWWIPVSALILLAIGVSMLTIPYTPPVQAQSSLDASPPTTTQKLVFVHASVGWEWVGGWLGGWQQPHSTGGLCYSNCLPYWDISLGGNNYNVRDWNTNIWDRPLQIGHGYCDWYSTFTDPVKLQALFDYNVVDAAVNGVPLYDALDLTDTSENDIIMIKPCFSDYSVQGSPNDPPSGVHGCGGGMTVGNVKQVMIDILEVFRSRPDKFFVLMTAPPASRSPENDQDVILYGPNARAVANWMVNDWLAGYDVGNVMVFDLYNVLTSNAEGPSDTCQRTTYPIPDNDSDWDLATGNHHRVWNGQIQHQQEYDTERSAYMCYDDNHPPSNARYKLTMEFVPLLNARVNAWLAGQGPLPTPTLVSPTSTPTSTPILPTATAVMPTDTPVPPTATVIAPTNTPVVPTATVIPPTPIPPTATPVLPTSTPAFNVPPRVVGFDYDGRVLQVGQAYTITFEAEDVDLNLIEMGIVMDDFAARIGIGMGGGDVQTCGLPFSPSIGYWFAYPEIAGSETGGVQTLIIKVKPEGCPWHGCDVDIPVIVSAIDNTGAVDMQNVGTIRVTP